MTGAYVYCSICEHRHYVDPETSDHNIPLMVQGEAVMVTEEEFREHFGSGPEPVAVPDEAMTVLMREAAKRREEQLDWDEEEEEE
jgi:hypothetical protein